MGLGDVTAGDEAGRAEDRLVDHPDVDGEEPGVLFGAGDEPWQAVGVAPVGLASQFGQAFGARLRGGGDRVHRLRLFTKSALRPPAHRQAWTSQSGSAPAG